jgi:hypothetical protein
MYHPGSNDKLHNIGVMVARDVQEAMADMGQFRKTTNRKRTEAVIQCKFMVTKASMHDLYTDEGSDAEESPVVEILNRRLDWLLVWTERLFVLRAGGMCFFESEASFEEVMCLTHGGQSVLGTTMRESLAQVI